MPLSALNKWLSHERSQPFWLAHEHEKLTPCQLKDQEVLTFWLWWTSGQWSCFLFCVKQYVPSVHWCCESFLEERRLLRKTTETPLLTTTQVQLWPKMAQELNAHGGWKEWGRHNNTHKEKSNGHFWSNFNTRLIVFSWTHCCQDVNCLGFFSFLFKT